MLTLYVAKGTVALASHLALEESGLDYHTQWISLATSDQRAPAYLAVNPKGRVPALDTEGGILTETPAILEYIAETSGRLMPHSIIDRARAREMMAYLASTMHVNHAHKMRGHRWSDDPAAHASMAAKVPQTMAESTAWIETTLPQTGWVAGTFSVADLHLYAVSRWLAGDGVDTADYPKLHALIAAIQARPATARILTSHA